MSNISDLIIKNGWDRYEGSSGLKNLARIVTYLGYKDIQQYGSFEPNVALGNIFEFLENNPGAIEKIVEFIEEFYGKDSEIENDEFVESEHEDNVSEDVRKQLKIAIESAKNETPVYLGSFAQYDNEEP